MEKAQVKWIGKMSFVGKANSKHPVVMDTNPEVGGEDAGVRPMELILIGLGGCTGMDVVSILKKMRVDFDSLTMEVEADRAKEYPRVYREIRLKYIIQGDDVPEEKFKRAIELSQTKYCAIGAMLKKAAQYTYSYEIVTGLHKT